MIEILWAPQLTNILPIIELMRRRDGACFEKSLKPKFTLFSHFEARSSDLKQTTTAKRFIFA